MSQPALPEEETERGSKPNPDPSHVSANPEDTLGQPAAEDPSVPDTVAMQEDRNTGATVLTSSSDTLVSSDDDEDDDDEDTTSSSGSDSSSASDSDADGPETATSHRAGPQKVPPPKRQDRRDKPICRDFLRAGRCRRGNRCRWRHALPGRGQKKVEEEKPSRPQRRSLHQRVSKFILRGHFIDYLC